MMHALSSVLFGRRVAPAAGAVLFMLLTGGSFSTAQTFGTSWFASVGGGIATHDNGAFSRRLSSYTPVGSDRELLLYQTEPFFGTQLVLVSRAL